jgi:hypothetical protein
MTIDMQQGQEYFVWKKPETMQPFRVVRREVRARTNKGYPISFTLKSIPETFESWDNAQSIADRLNEQLISSGTPDWFEEDLAEIE